MSRGMPAGTRPQTGGVLDERFIFTRDQLREALHRVYYPVIQATDVAGMARIERATDKVLEAMGL